MTLSYQVHFYKIMAATSVLVVGGTGFLGSAVIGSLQAMHPEWSVAVFDLKNALHPIKNVKYLVGDLLNFDDLRTAMVEIRPVIIIHTAGLVPALAYRYGREYRDKVWSVNVEGTKNILAVAKESSTRAFVWTGSFCCVTDDMSRQYPNVDESWPTSNQSLIYGESKVSISPS